MRPVDPAELSGLLDGELDEGRAGEVRAQLAADPVLAAEFASLEAQDAILRAAALTAAFTPAVRLHRTPRRVAGLAVAGGVGVLVALRIAPRLLEGQSAGFALQALVLTAILIGVVWFALADERDAPPATATV